jgi:hypothetical protein
METTQLTITIKIPDWDEVWIAQERDGEIFLYNQQPIPGPGGCWFAETYPQRVAFVADTCKFEAEWKNRLRRIK